MPNAVAGRGARIGRPLGARAILIALVGAVALWVVAPVGAAQAQPQSNAQLRLGAPLRVMPLGDSITKDDGAGVPGAYRTRLWQLAQQDAVPLEFVGSLSDGPRQLPDSDHEGHGGFSISDLDRIVGPALRTHRPDVVLLHIGTNDMFKQDVRTASRDLSVLVDHVIAAAPQARLYVAAIVPQPRYEAFVQEFNQATRSMVFEKAAGGASIEFVDIHDALEFDDLHDGVHPTPEGYEKMAEQWWSAISADL